MVHELKTWSECFHDIWWNRKTFELRYNDRNYQVGDTLLLKEWNKDTQEFTGRECMRTVTSMLSGPRPGLSEGWVIMSIKPL